jgi:hypothetical protein
VRGRALSGFALIWQSTRLASLLLGGLLADTAGIRAVYYLGRALLAAAALTGLALARPADAQQKIMPCHHLAQVMAGRCASGQGGWGSALYVRAVSLGGGCRRGQVTCWRVMRRLAGGISGDRRRNGPTAADPYVLGTVSARTA